MSTVNKVILLGRLGQDPKLHTFQSGSTVCNFSMATDKRYKDRDGDWVSEAQWHNVKVWGKQGEMCDQYLSKGQLVHVVGSIEYRQYEDKEGVKRYVTDIVAEPFGVTFIREKGEHGSGRSSRDSGGGRNERQPSGGVDAFDTGFSDQDIPF